MTCPRTSAHREDLDLNLHCPFCAMMCTCRVWAVTTGKWLLRTQGGTLRSIHSPQPWLGSRRTWDIHIAPRNEHVMSYSCAPWRGAPLDGKGGACIRAKSPVLTHQFFSVSSATRKGKKKNQNKTGLCQETLAAMTQRYMGGRSVDSEGPFFSHLAAFTTL